jgi:response regulator of citrate/malate metabolism
MSLCQNDSGSKPFLSEAPARKGGPLAGLRVLIADQHFTVRTWMREQMSVIGATSIAMAANASELMRMVRALPYDIVICDHHLDEKRDGQQLLEELRYQHILPLRSVFIIATAERKYNHVAAAAEFAPDDYLIKPYTPDQLYTRLDRSLQKKKALRHVLDHLEVDEHEAAIAACDKAMKKSPRYVLDALRLKAESLVALGRPEEAATIYESIIATRAIPWARMGYAMTLQKQHRLDEAKDEAHRLNEEHPEFISVYDMLAKMHEETGEFSKAIDCLERASAITSSSSTDRLRKIADIAEVAGDREKVISTLKRVVERTKRSALLKVDDYLTLTRSLLEEERVDEASRVAEEMRTEAKEIQSGKMGTEVASAMVHRGKGQMDAAKTCMERVFDMLDANPAEASDNLTMEIAEEAVQQGNVERATELIAKVSVKASLPGKIKARLNTWLGPEAGAKDGNVESTTPGVSRKAVLGEQIVLSMIETIEQLAENWSDTAAAKAREKLIDAFTLLPRDKRVINAHIRYNSIAVKHGGERHSPTTRSESA